MRFRLPTRVMDLRHKAADALSGPQMLAFVPALTLAGFWVGGEPTLMMIALSVPVAWLLLGGFEGVVNRRAARAGGSGLVAPDAFIPKVQTVRDDAPGADLTSAIFAIELDEFSMLANRYEPEAIDVIL